MINHYHLIVKFNTNNPIVSPKKLKVFLLQLVKHIKMKVLLLPAVKRVGDIGNEGLSGVILIKTSHISCHIWDKFDPPLVHMDIYSCKKFDISKALAFIKKYMKAYNIKYVFLNRDDLSQKYD
jgi:S-adenosylmethionine/arginine decarboxylase-like enzyme